VSFWQKLRESLFGLIGMTGYEYPGVGPDVVLSVPMAFAALILIVYPAESHPSERLRYAAASSLVVLIAGLVLARRKFIVIASVAAIVGFRGLIAAAFGLWQGLLIAVGALAVVVFCARNSGIE
jgi:hypothetical protein